MLQPWYADDGTMRGTGDDVAVCFHKLCRAGPQYGYFPEPAKSWAVCVQEDQTELKRIFAAAKLPVKWSWTDSTSAASLDPRQWSASGWRRR